MSRLVIILVALLTITRSTFADALRDWIHQKIVSDEKDLTKSLLKIDGYDIDLLATSRWYVPFFLELPSDVPKDRPIPEAFIRLVNSCKKSFVPGGYLFRISFKNGYTLYATSAGEWDSLWFDPDARQEFRIEPLSVRTALKVPKERYVTVLAGAPPRLVVYDIRGTVVNKHEFDLHSATLESDIAEMLQREGTEEPPSIQMLLLGEYLEGRDLPWRPLSSNPNINFRNQQEDPSETERIARFVSLRREQAQERLQRATSENKYPNNTEQSGGGRR